LFGLMMPMVLVLQLQYMVLSTLSFNSRLVLPKGAAHNAKE
jgi:hypothetical protein